MVLTERAEHIAVALVRLVGASGIGLLLLSAHAQTSDNPPTTASFSQAIKDFAVHKTYTFGTGTGKTVRDLQQLAANFSPYGTAGKSVINREWERYQEFNSQNFVFTRNSLDITATIPHGGGLLDGGINSGQICSKDVFKPAFTGYMVYAFEVRMKIPSGAGMWPGASFYTKVPSEADTSEIDNPRFFMMRWQNEFDWTGGQAGPGLGAQIYSIKTNSLMWHPGVNFSADYHNYQTVWTPTAVYKYVDGTLVHAQSFRWTARGGAQLTVNLAVGSSDTVHLPGLQPTSLSQFPSVLSIDHITVWVK